MCDAHSCGGGDGGARRRRPAVTLEKRRAFLQGLASLPLVVVLAEPMLARAAGNTLEKVTIRTRSGDAASGFLALPAASPAPAVLLIHEWWGLNDQIKAVASELAQQGFVALAADLYDGSVATTPAEARRYMSSMDPERATQALVAWIDWLRGHPKGNGKVGTVGWCFGGGWSLNASIAAPVDATVIYYGDVRRSAAELASLQGPVMGHFGTLDARIDAEMVGGFQKAMAEAGKTRPEVYWYVADHAFANPSGARYDEEDAKLAWARTLAFFYRHLG